MELTQINAAEARELYEKSSAEYSKKLIKMRDDILLVLYPRIKEAAASAKSDIAVPYNSLPHSTKLAHVHDPNGFYEPSGLAFVVEAFLKVVLGFEVIVGGTEFCIGWGLTIQES